MGFGCKARPGASNGTREGTSVVDGNEKINFENVFESRISAGLTEKLPGWAKPHAETVAWSYDVEGHAKKCIERYCELANKKTEQLYKGLNSLLG